MTETWKPIPDYEGYYEVSDLGRVRRLAYWRCRCGDCLAAMRKYRMSSPAVGNRSGAGPSLPAPEQAGMQ